MNLLHIKNDSFILLKSLLVLVVIFQGCSNSNTGPEVTKADEFLIFLSEEFPDFKLMNSSFDQEISSPYQEFTQYFHPGIETGYPFIFAYDLNVDGYDDFIASIYKTYVLDNPDSRYDSVFESKTILAFGSDDGFTLNSKAIGFQQGVFNVFNDSLAMKRRFKLGVVPPGTYRRGYPFSDSLQLEQVGLGVYHQLTAGVTVYFSPDSSISYPIYLD